MKIVKLNAINSTNTFLKDLVRESTVESYTVIVTEEQTEGKGQFKNKWISEKGKNLTFSTLCKFEDFDIENSFYLNCAVSIAVFNVLKNYIKEKLKIKWPNDILSSSKKLCGILIENTVSNGKITQSIIGVGLNINQQKFPDSLGNATSLKIITNKNFDKDQLLELIIIEIKKQVKLIENKEFAMLKQVYEREMHRLNRPAMFKDNIHGNFLGKILGITNQGKLVVELENDQLETYDLKEIQFI